MESVPPTHASRSANDVDLATLTYNMMYCILRDNTDPGSVTSKKNVLFQQVYKGEG